jgi:hypothetical protein
MSASMVYATVNNRVIVTFKSRLTLGITRALLP